MSVPFDEFDHESHMQEAFALAHEAAERGDNPFGSVLVRDDEIVMRESNRTVTEEDIRWHPELHLAYRACRELEPEMREETVMYTSTEPCPMCATGMKQAGFSHVVYSTSSEDIGEFTGNEPVVRSAELLEGISEVVGPVSNEEGMAIHREYEWWE